MKKEKIIDTAATEATVETVAVEAVTEAPLAKVEKPIKKPATKTVSVELTDEQYNFLAGWQKTHEAELGIEVPIGALVRKTVDIAMKAKNTKPENSSSNSGNRDSGGERKSFSDRPKFGDRQKFGGRDSDRGSRPSFGGRDGGRPSFGSRPSFGGASRGPKFGIRKFDK